MTLAARGQVHAIVGENGAGKSTVLGLAAGRLPSSSGDVLVDGTKLHTGTPREARRHGIRAIYQELTIVPALSPEANVFLGQHWSRAGWLREREMRAEYERLCAQLGVNVSTVSRSGDLSVAEQQILEILRAVASNASALLFDEPTASLAHAEREALFRTIADLAAQDMAIAFVSHDLEEVLEHTDSVTVMRDGSLVEGRPTSEWTKPELVSAMLGEGRGLEIAAGVHIRAESGPDGQKAPAHRGAAPIMVVEGLNAGRARNISFELFPGEILGIAGLVGSGRTSLLRAIAGVAGGASGVVRTNSGSASVPSNVPEARRRGIALLPESRKTQGLVLSRNAADNIVLGEWKRLSRWGFAGERAIRAAATEPARRVRFDTRRLGSQALELSGGNQQKLMLARWLHTDHDILLADEPTRGVDVGAKGDILLALEEIVASGRSVILVSSELEEVLGLSDRVLVLNGGRLVGTLDAAAGPIDPTLVLHMMFETDAMYASAQPTGDLS
jgi:ABC-type sugar transport system ATPase subunit